MRPRLSSFAYVLIEALRRLGLNATSLAAATASSICLKPLKIGAIKGNTPVVSVPGQRQQWRRKPLHLVVDGLSAHKTKTVRVYVNRLRSKLTLHFPRLCAGSESGRTGLELHHAHGHSPQSPPSGRTATVKVSQACAVGAVPEVVAR